MTRHRRARAGGADADDADDADGGPSGPEADPDAPHAGEPPSWWAPAAEAFARFSQDLAQTATDNAGRAVHRDGDGDGLDGGGGDGDAPATHRIDTCGICPICVGLRALGEARPELLTHLSEAARHVALAVRAVADSAATPRPAPGDAAPADDRLTRIDLDDDL